MKENTLHTTKAVGVGWLAVCTTLMLAGWVVIATFAGSVWITLGKQACVFCLIFTAGSAFVVTLAILTVATKNRHYRIIIIKHLYFLIL